MPLYDKLALALLPVAVVLIVLICNSALDNSLYVYQAGLVMAGVFLSKVVRLIIE